jgi:hypothetical protein
LLNGFHICPLDKDVLYWLKSIIYKDMLCRLYILTINIVRVRVCVELYYHDSLKKRAGKRGKTR